MIAAGDTRGFAAEVNRLMVSPTPAACARIARALDDVSGGVLPWPEVRLGVLASFTIDAAAPIIKALAAESGLLVRTHVVGGDQWPQEVLDPASGLREFTPDVIVVALELEDLNGTLAHDYLDLSSAEVEEHVAQITGRIRELLQGLRSWTNARILLHEFTPFADRSLGILDASHTRGRTRAIADLQQRVRQEVANVRDTYLVDVGHLIAQVGHMRWHDPRMWTLARLPYSTDAMIALSREYLRYLRAFTGRARKVLALDLDGTLWGGIVGEDGPDGIHLGVGYRGRAFVQFQRALRQLTRRGVLLAINSKNNPEDAWEVIDRHPSMVLRRDDFAATRINWQDKATNLIELAEELSLGLDSFVFVDDNAAECERIRQALPEVLTVHLAGDPSTFAHTISALGVFDTLTFGDEDRARTAMYRSEAQRRELQQSMTSLDEFYRTLEMILAIEPVSGATLKRASELTQRTNQFNLTTRRFTQDELREYLAGAGHEGFVFSLRDRFGDHGTIGLALTERHGDTVVIATLLMSCRVLKRTVEDSVLAFLVQRAREQGAEKIEGWFRPTRKNGLAATLYETHGFERLGEAEEGLQRYVRPASSELPASPWIRIEPRGSSAHAELTESRRV